MGNKDKSNCFRKIAPLIMVVMTVCFSASAVIAYLYYSGSSYIALLTSALILFVSAVVVYLTMNELVSMCSISQKDKIQLRRNYTHDREQFVKQCSIQDNEYE